MALREDDFKALDQMDREANARLRETEVVKHLLPHLIPNPDDPTPRNMEIYVAAAGHPTKMIDVVSDTDPNTVLYTIPPLLAPSPMIIRQIDPNPETDIGEMAAMFEAEITTNHPGAVIDNFVSRLVGMNYAPTDAITTVYSLMWAKIYKRYNIPLERLFGEQADDVRRILGMVEEGEPKSNPKGPLINDLDPDEDFEPI